ncbi:MAG TPA: tetratricopeptide repeat protein, partial [Woeseiaceae bacterium]|nr:tetratricopeptide repeat protein [Woeseiaceae bacterium]
MPGLLLPIIALATTALSLPASARAQEPGNAGEAPGSAVQTTSQDPGGLANEKPKAPAEQEAPGGTDMSVTAESPGTDLPFGNKAGAASGEAPGDEYRETPEEKLQRYFELYKEAMENEVYAEADVLAKQVVELSIAIFGIDSLDSARALTNLGIAQHQTENYESAIANYEAAIDVIERTEDRLNKNLVNPLKGLGAAQLASGRPDLASETFERAVHVTHVNEGPHNLMQVEVLESLAETYLAVGKLDEVEVLTEIIFGLEARGLALDSMEILPVLEKQAYWQHRLQLFEKERYTWRKVIDIIEDNSGDDDLRLIPPLTGLGKSYLYVGTMDSPYYQPTAITSGEVYLKRAVRIAEDNPDATWQMQEDTLLALGDFYILSGQASRARRVYQDAWELLSSGEERLANRREHLETLVVLQDINPPKYVGIDGEVRSQLPGDDYETGKIVYDYSVTSRGFTNDVVLVEA